MKFSTESTYAAGILASAIRSEVEKDVMHRSHRITLTKYETDLTKISKNRQRALEILTDALRLSFKDADVHLSGDEELLIKEH